MDVYKIITLAVFCFLFLWDYVRNQVIKGRGDVRSTFVFHTLAIDKRKLDASYYFTYDNLQWDGKIIAVGDLHGDIESLRAILTHANLIDEQDNWVAHNVLLIQVGDVLNKGIYGPIIYDLLFKLQKQAEKKNSKVLLILGNHEERNLCGELRYLHSDEVKVLYQNDYEKRVYDFTNKNGYYYKRLIRMPSIIKVNKIIFTHGGISKSFAKFSIDLINIKIRLQIENKCKVVKYDPFNYLNAYSVLWYKTMSQKVKSNELKVCNVLFQILNRFDGNRLVVGHTKQMSHKISAFCHNSYFLIDTSMSHFLNDGQAFPSYLKIEYEEFTAVHLNMKQNTHARY